MTVDQGVGRLLERVRGAANRPAHWRQPVLSIARQPQLSGAIDSAGVALELVTQQLVADPIRPAAERFAAFARTSA